MTWEIAGTIAGIVVLYFGGIFAVARFITKPIEQRIDDLKTQMTDMKTQIGDVKTHIMQDLQKLDNHLTRVEGKIDNHIADYSIHNMS